MLPIAILSAACCLGGCATHKPTSRFVVNGVVPENLPIDTVVPVAVPLPAGQQEAAFWTALVTFDNNDPVPVAAQYELGAEDSDDARVWLMLKVKREALGRPVSIAFEATEKMPACAYAVRYNARELHVATSTGSPILSYFHGTPIPGLRYPFSDYIHPIIGLDGEVLTDLRPRDHIHHRGLYWAWVRQTSDGQELGSWWQPKTVEPESGKVGFGIGPVFAWFEAHHFLTCKDKTTGTTQRFIENNVICRVFETTASGRAIDVDLEIRPTDKPVQIGGTTSMGKGYGGLTFRYGPADKVQIQADGEKLKKDGVGYQAHWADWNGIFKQASGKANTGRSGAAVLVSPSHPNYPPTWLMRHYGVLNVAYPGLEMLEVQRETPLRLRYRLWIHRGDAEAGGVEAQYKAYTADWHWTTAAGDS